VRRLIHNPDTILEGLVGEGQIVLDIGCGMGYFTIPMARRVGPDGRVIAVDLQPQMLEKVVQRARRAGLAGRIHIHQSQPERIGLEGRVDFALAFWMVHEVPDQEAFLSQVYHLLKEGGRFLLVEPQAHVSKAAFQATVEAACRAGLRMEAERKVRLSRAVVFSAGD
jgi:ubiquinone/menaquinone biosynthesis C-methylase UbiE